MAPFKMGCLDLESHEALINATGDCSNVGMVVPAGAIVSLINGALHRGFQLHIEARRRTVTVGCGLKAEVARVRE